MEYKKEIIDFLALGYTKYLKMDKKTAEQTAKKELEKGRSVEDIVRDIFSKVGKTLPDTYTLADKLKTYIKEKKQN